MRVINLDEIRPEQYESNIERYGVGGCIICGRPLSERDMENGKFVHWLPNGDITDSQELDGKITDNHRLPEWHQFIDWIKTLPLAEELIFVGIEMEE